MKELLLTILLATGIAGTVLASGGDKEGKENRKEVKEKQVQAYVEAALTKAYGASTTEQWKVTAITRKFRQGASAQQGSRKSLFFTPDNARMLANIELVDAAELSGKMTKKLARKYKGYHIAQVIRYHDGETLYFVSLKKDQDEVLVSYAR